ncbi:hypothetical protein RM190_00570 [Paracoccus sp. CPCC 101403]|uniref:Bacteriophage tail tape measure C-terminal domain-containing protein n=1 Tax=Paracoccus broussonetiae TaxID=3075834 RepID=A0ABU3E7Y3_9RHOB|nr:hypothetical protein [Paracoccus sp. CPCC 101403]MDT1060326.1 hypothetical protein [Paracoccus sp. CPCC 101403]
MATGSTQYEVRVEATGLAELTQLARAFESVAQRVEGLTKAEASRLRAVNQNLKLTGQAVTQTNKLADATKRAATAESSLAASAANTNAALAKQNASTGKFTSGLQNASYQLQDVIVQVTGGTSAVRALGQQLPQLLSGFGAIGAVVGVVAAALPALWSAFAGGKEIKKFADAADALQSSLDGMADLLDQIAISADNVAKGAGNAAKSTLELNRQLLLLKQQDVAEAQADAFEAFTNEMRGQLRWAEDLNFTLQQRDEIQKRVNAGLASAEDLNRLQDLEQRITRIGTKLGLNEQQAERFARAMGEALEQLRDHPGTDASQQAITNLLATASELGIVFPKAARELLAGLAAGDTKAKSLNDTLKKLDDILQGNGDAADDMADAFDRAKDAAESLRAATLSLNADTAGILAEADALGRGLDSFAAAAARIKASRWAELQTQLIGANTEAVVKATEAYDKWAESVDRNADAQRRLAQQQQDAADAAKAQEDAIGAVRAMMEDYTRKRNAAYDNLDSILAGYDDEEQAILRRARVLADAIHAVEEYGDVTEDELARMKVAWAKLDEELKEHDAELSEIGKIIESSFNDLFGSIVDGSKTASEAFEEMLLDMLNSITKFLFSQQLNEFLGLLAQTSGFGFMSANGGAPAAPSVAAPQALAMPRLTASSGTTTAGVPGAIVMPRVPIQQATGPMSGRAGGTNNIAIHNHGSSQITATRKPNQNGGEDIEIQVRDAMRRVISTGGVDQQMRVSYGLRRQS